MLHSLNPLQDENSQPYAAGKRLGSETRKFLGSAGSTPSSKQSGLSSARKALGNITNRTTQQQENATPCKKTPTVHGRRKALGDITNATPAGNAHLTRPLLDKAAQQKGSAATSRLAKQKSKAEIYAEEGVERLAGKSQAQLDAERQLKDMQDASSRAAQLASLPALRPPVLQWSKGVFEDWTTFGVEVVEAPPSPKFDKNNTDDLLAFESPSSLLPEVSSGDLDVLSDTEEEFEPSSPRKDI